MKAISEKIILEVIKESPVTRGGIIMPETMELDFLKGKVISSGKGVEEVKSGDIVLFSSNVGFNFTHEGKVYKIINKLQVIAIL